MNSERKIHDEQLMVRYLLGELSEGEGVRFEEDCFADDRCFEELLAVEAELTDDYVHGRLVGLRRERFEKKLLNTRAGRDEVEFARIITGPPVQFTQAPVPAPVSIRSSRGIPFGWLQLRSRAFQFSLAAVALVLLGLGVWSVWSFRQTRLAHEQSAQQRAPLGSQPQESPPTPVESPEAGPAPGVHQAAGSPEPSQPQATYPGQTTPAPKAATIVSLLLVSGFDRSVGGANDLMIPANARTVRLRLTLESGNYRSYQAVLRSVEGKEIFRRSGLKPRATRSGGVVTLDLPASGFPEGDQILSLGGATSEGQVEDVQKYFLSVRKKP